MSKQRINGCILCLPIFIGFILGVCLLSGCHSQKKVVETVSVDSVAQTTETASTCVNSEATSIKNLSLQFDSLEMILFPPLAPTVGATCDSLVAPRVGGSLLTELFPSGYQAPIYLRASRASLASESAQKSTVDSSSAVRNDASIDMRSHSDRSDETVRTAVSKPPDINWTFIICFAVFCASIIICFRLKK